MSETPKLVGKWVDLWFTRCQVCDLSVQGPVSIIQPWTLAHIAVTGHKHFESDRPAKLPVHPCGAEAAEKLSTMIRKGKS